MMLRTIDDLTEPGLRPNKTSIALALVTEDVDAGVFVAKTAAGVRVAVTGAGPSVFRVKAMEDALARSFSSDAIKDIKIPSDDLNSDIHGSAEYRAHLIAVLTRRAVEAATGKA